MLQKLIEEGWGYHDTESARLAAELDAAATEPPPDDLVVRFIRLSTHTIGEHLGDWPRASRLTERALAGRAPTAATGKAWIDLSIARLLAGDGPGAMEAELTGLAAAPDLGAALCEARFMLATALIGSGDAAAAARIYGRALDLAGVLGEAAPARAIGVTSNNLAFNLYETPDRSAEASELMRVAADAALTYWLRAGDWTNHEKGLYLKSLVATALGEPANGLALAAEGLDIIAANSPRPIDAAFLHLARVSAFAALGEAAAAEAELALGDTAAAGAPSPDLQSWYQEERGKAAGAIPALAAS